MSPVLSLLLATVNSIHALIKLIRLINKKRRIYEVYTVKFDLNHLFLFHDKGEMGAH